MKRCFKIFLFCFLLFQCTALLHAQQNIDSLNISVPYTVFRSMGDSLSIEALISKNELFQTPNITSAKNNRKDAYWVRADFSSLAPLLSKDSLWYLQTGGFYNITCYFQNRESIDIRQYGPLNSDEKYSFYKPRDGVYFGQKNLINGRFLFFKIKLYSSKEDFSNLHLKLRSAQQKNIESHYYRWEDVVSASKDYLFVGGFIVIFFFTFVTYFMSRKLDFLFYSLYTLCLLLYLGRSAYNVIVFVAVDYPIFGNWSHTSLQILINLFYIAFAKKYMETAIYYPKLDKAIRWTLVFLIVLILINTYFSLTFQLDEQQILMNLHRLIMSLFALAAVIYLLRYGKRGLYYFIVVGSLIFTAGSLIMLFTGDRHYMMLGSVLEVLIFGMGLNFKMRKMSKDRIQLRQMAHEHQISALRAQMNPHFIFNSLSSIQHLITSGNKESAIKYLNKFSLLMRNLLESSIESKIVLSEEISLLKKYLELEALRFNNTFKFSISVAENLDAEAIEVPALLVQPFVENAILHGLLNKPGNDKLLKVRFRKEDTFVICEIEDNGIGRKAAAEKKSPLKASKKSRGIELTEKRLELLNHSQNNSIDIIDKTNEKGEAEGTLVILKISIE
ncbi:MAG: histidine kinase [Aequorivita antarctica]